MITKKIDQMFAFVAIAIALELVWLWFHPTQELFYFVSGLSSLLLVVVTWLLVKATARLAELQQMESQARRARPRIADVNVLPGGLEANDGKPYVPYVTFAMRNQGGRPIEIDKASLIAHYARYGFNPETDEVMEHEYRVTETLTKPILRRTEVPDMELGPDEQGHFESRLQKIEFDEDLDYFELQVHFTNGRIETWLGQPSIEARHKGRDFSYNPWNKNDGGADD